MKNEKILYSIGEISDDYIIEAEPKEGKSRKLLKKPFLLIAAIIAMLSLSAFAAYDAGLFDYWFQKPSQNPIETVRTAIENQIDKEYTLKAEIESLKIDELETERVVAMYSGSELAKERGWTDEYLAGHFVVVWASYYVEYDHTKTFLEDGHIGQYFYLTQDEKTGAWTITDNTSAYNID